MCRFRSEYEVSADASRHMNTVYSLNHAFVDSSFTIHSVIHFVDITLENFLRALAHLRYPARNMNILLLVLQDSIAG